MTARRAFAVVAALAVVAVAGCGDDDSTDAGGDGNGAAAPNTVVLRNIEFQPDELTVDAGETVTWRWDDGNIVHDVKFDDFASELQNEGTFEHTFDEPGEYDYVCSVHPQMDGTIVVR